jgi:peptide/nickel transport system permease protein
LKGREFIESARTLGLGTFHIIFGELLPNVAPFIYISFVYAMLGAMGGALGLFFIGLGALEMDNWGMMLNQALSQGIVFLSKSAAILYFIAPVMAILLLTLSLVFLSSGFEAVFNPRLREE